VARLQVGDPRQAEVRAAASYATQMNGLADEQDLRLRFDVLTKTESRAEPRGAARVHTRTARRVPARRAHARH
jgi:hypothetical protein